MKKTYNIFNALLIVAILIGDVLYILKGTLLIKSIVSAGFVILGGINLWYVFKHQPHHKKLAIVKVLGLFFAMLGDILLEIHFITGALLFAVGHVFYFFAYSCIIPFKPKDLLYGAAIFVPSVLFITLAPIFDFGGIVMEIVCVVYAIIISCMVGKAISNVVQAKTIMNIVILVGSCLFFFSCLMLLLNVFGNMPRIIGVLCLATYYPAECVLAYSLLCSDKKEEKQAENQAEQSTQVWVLFLHCISL